jgi:uncharacterized SAM-binding protein YcdF (DUF218 family)
VQIYLHKILPIFLLPLGITLLLVVAGLLLRRRAIICIGLAVLYLGSTSVVSQFMIQSVEGWAERSPSVDAPRADAIVVLSGGRIVAPGVEGVSEWSDADRFYGGVELFQTGKAPLLIFTGGWVPWEPSAKPEGEILIEYAKALGVPAKSMITTGAVMNTAEEAQAVAALLAQRQAGADQGTQPHILLVTSAFHMSRAQYLFTHAGLEVTPFPVDFQVSAGGEVDVMDFLPSADALAQTERAWREMYGRMYYGVRGVLQ